MTRAKSDLLVCLPVVLAAGLLVACFPSLPPGADGEVTSDPGKSGDGDGDSGDGDDSDPIEDTEGSQTGTDDPDDTDDTDDTEECWFIPCVDVPPDPSTCDFWVQDCPEGQKCVPWAGPGEPWEGYACVDVHGDVPPGEPCIYTNGEIDHDDCDDGGYCHNLQEIEGQLVGMCAPFCMGDLLDPECIDGYFCQIPAEDPPYCALACDPIAQGCGEGMGCYWSDHNFQCVLTTDQLATGDVCGYVNDCAPGNMCLTADIQNCPMGSSCCASFCDLGLGDGPCQAIDPAYQCLPFFEDGEAPVEYEHVGLCALTL